MRKPAFVCSACGAVHAKWAGRCDACGAWNTIAEDPGLSDAGPKGKTLGAKRGRKVELTDLAVEDAALPRRTDV